jgi:hypothetical protein
VLLIAVCLAALTGGCVVTALRPASTLPEEQLLESSSACTDEYRKTTLKTLVEKPVLGMMADDDHDSIFEASDVTQVGDFLYVVCDSSWRLTLCIRLAGTGEPYLQVS